MGERLVAGGGGRGRQCRRTHNAERCGDTDAAGQEPAAIQKVSYCAGLHAPIGAGQRRPLPRWRVNVARRLAVFPVSRSPTTKNPPKERAGFHVSGCSPPRCARRGPWIWPTRCARRPQILSTAPSQKTRPKNGRVSMCRDAPHLAALGVGPGFGRLAALAARKSCQQPRHKKPAQRTGGFPCVGMTGFEPATLRSQSGCATKLRYIPVQPKQSSGHWPCDPNPV